MKILTVFGTRPEIIKLSPLIPLMNKRFKHIMVHTGQHYSHEMDMIFFKELNLKYPKYNLKVGSCSPANQISRIWVGLEKIILKEKPNLVVVFGDTNSTIGGALSASKLHIPLMHIEAGCRSFNKDMPEEINRIVVDHVSDYLLTPNTEGLNNLLSEGIPRKKIRVVGSIIVDACKLGKELSKKSSILDKLKLENYILATIHRAENTNNLSRLKGLFDALNTIAKKIDIVLSCHPRTKWIIKKNNLKVEDKVKIIDSVGYKDFTKLLIESKFVMTDSGGIQEEAAVLNVPCLVLREETEWVKYIKLGKNILVGINKDNIVNKARSLLRDENLLNRMKMIKIDKKIGVSRKIADIISNI
jgi:UDP-N-acetylglucosamine 2-epimerase